MLCKLITRIDDLLRERRIRRFSRKSKQARARGNIARFRLYQMLVLREIERRSPQEWRRQARRLMNLSAQ